MVTLVPSHGHTAVNPGAILPVGLPRPAAPASSPSLGDESGKRPGVRGPAWHFDLLGSAFVLLWLVYVVTTFVYSVVAYVRGQMGPAWPPSCLVGQ